MMRHLKQILLLLFGVAALLLWRQSTTISSPPPPPPPPSFSSSSSSPSSSPRYPSIEVSRGRVNWTQIAHWSHHRAFPSTSSSSPSSSSRRIFLICLFMTTAEARSIIPYFISHYSSFGIEKQNMLITLHTTNASDPQFLITKSLLESLGVFPDVVVAEYTTYVNQEAYTKWWNIKNITVDDWIIPLDMDEFQFYGIIPDRGTKESPSVTYLHPSHSSTLFPPSSSSSPSNWKALLLPDLLTLCEEQGWSYIHGVFRDRVHAEGKLEPVLPYPSSVLEHPPSLFEQYPMDCLMVNISGAHITKIIAHRGFLGANRGHHQIDEFLQPEFVGGREDVPLPKNLIRKPPFYLPVFHFKWTDNVVQLLETRIESYRRLKLRWWNRSNLYLKHIHDHQNRICLECKYFGKPLCEPGFNPFHSDFHPDSPSARVKHQYT